MLKILFLLLLTALSSALFVPSLHERIGTHIFHLKNLTLQFEFACSNLTEPILCMAGVEWNGQRVKELRATDKGVHKVELKVIARYGANVLTFVGLGDSHHDGINIGRVSLTRMIYRSWKGSFPESLIKNGNFEDIYFLNRPNSWQGQGIMISNASSTNPAWKEGQHLCQLHSNVRLSQTIYLGPRLQIISKTTYDKLSALEMVLVLTFDYAAHENTNLLDNRFSVLWNGKVVADITPTDYNVHKALIKFQPLPGQKNTLTFKGLGNNSTIGCGFHKAGIRRKFSLFHMLKQPPRFVKDQWFESHRFVISKEETIFDNGMEHWSGSPIYISLSTQVNSHWDKGNINHFPVCELSKGMQVSQDIYFDAQYRHIEPKPIVDKNDLMLGFSYAAYPGSNLSNNAFKVVFNGVQIAEVIPKDFKKHYRRIRVKGIVGQNLLQFMGEGNQPGKGAGITEITLKRLAKKIYPENLVKNFIFNFKHMKCSDEGWQGNNLTIVSRKTYNHSWSGHHMKGCVCALLPQSRVYYDFELNSVYEYVDPQQNDLPIKTKKTVLLQYGYYPHKQTPLSDNSFAIELNGKIVKEFQVTNYKQLQGRVELEGQVGKNTVRLIGTGKTAGKGGGFNFIRLLRESAIFHPNRLLVDYLNRVHYSDPCPQGLKQWKGDAISILDGKKFNPRIFFDCVAQLKKGQAIQGTFTFDDKYQTI